MLICSAGNELCHALAYIRMSDSRDKLNGGAMKKLNSKQNENKSVNDELRNQVKAAILTLSPAERAALLATLRDQKQ